MSQKPTINQIFGTVSLLEDKIDFGEDDFSTWVIGLIEKCAKDKEAKDKKAQDKAVTELIISIPVS